MAGDQEFEQEQNNSENQGNGDGGSGDGNNTGRYVPEGLPEHFLGESDKDTIDKVYGAYKGLRSEDKPQAPEDPSGYTFEPNETLAPYFENPTEDPVFKAATAAAHKAGMTNDQFGSLLDETFTELVKTGQIEPPYNPEAELKKTGELLGLSDSKEVSQVVVDNEAFAKNLAAQMKLPEPAAEFVESLTDLAGGNAFLHGISQLLSSRGITISESDGGRSNGSLTKEDLKKLDSDDRIDPNSPKYDPKLRAEYDEGYKRLYR
ncbi:hypothetical protein [Pseudovibrio sp. POLY-S9]|uniref:hypothetical protein n=1 Tax=Pseudovibrio sp. POLY-S9 TaxID=1576596 RepID=UPI000708BC95|nr:hypothetical protein [Pseudovibrio sp. POLY-S9]